MEQIVLSVFMFEDKAMKQTKEKPLDEKLDAARSTLAKAREPQALTQWELMLSLQDAFTAARDAGKSKEEMHEALKANGINIRFNTFRKYISEILLDNKRASNKKQRSTPTQTPPSQDPRGTAANSLRSARSTQSNLFDC